ncbi:alpha/beta hydrolase [Flavobacterium akiainvivens]|uniref:Alpha/beta hydrolase n=1 Tax=Flavobacterium akiainvivens TaxID=1202724 RepID=A0A0M8M898_9FLAO|nr:alpha/beta hydrolase [Flavobacterium akiainvivens]KOS05573.1 alpha/beta hydrolase [Flavobacterium akiainvivens]SFQ34562.1 Acetyl esterase/lipase [Flavobacterium akiainvivens]
MNTSTLIPQIVPVAIDPAISLQTKQFLAALNSGGGDPLETMSPEDARLVLVGAQNSVSVDYSGIDESEKTITQDGYTVKLNIVKPQGSTETLPVFIFIHGGGWVLGDYPTHRRMVRDLVVLSGAAAVFVNYTPSPEAHYPQAVNEIYAATKWVAQNGAEINVDGSRLSIVGNSVGGNMTAVTTLKSIENNGPKLKNIIMFWPIVAADFETATYQQYGQDRFLTIPLMKWMYNHYTSNLAEREEIYASPINAGADLLKQFPPTLIQVAEADVLREEGEAFGRKLDEAGVEATTIRYNGMIHDFGLLNPLAHLPQTKSLFVHAAAELKKYLFA